MLVSTQIAEVNISFLLDAVKIVAVRNTYRLFLAYVRLRVFIYPLAIRTPLVAGTPPLHIAQQHPCGHTVQRRKTHKVLYASEIQTSLICFLGKHCGRVEHG